MALHLAFRPSFPQGITSKVSKMGMSTYKFLHKIVEFGVRELAQNPELRTKTANLVKDQIAPQAKAVWQKAKPSFEQAKDTAAGVAKDVADVVGRP